MVVEGSTGLSGLIGKKKKNIIGVGGKRQKWMIPTIINQQQPFSQQKYPILFRPAQLLHFTLPFLSSLVPFLSSSFPLLQFTPISTIHSRPFAAFLPPSKFCSFSSHTKIWPIGPLAFLLLLPVIISPARCSHIQTVSRPLPSSLLPPTPNFNCNF